MKLTPLNLYNVSDKNYFKNKISISEKKENFGVDNRYEYNPIAYRDYNVSFGARLFRTPENFYAQSFNQYGMPITMKNYLYDDFEDRQKMPPAQMFKLVYEDIKYASSLDEVKNAFPEEPLFADLSDTSNRKSRTGVIAEVELMEQDGQKLFKDSDDSLALYILKKIYTEGKTLKEINTDFQKDISEDFKGVSPIDYTTLSAYGIKYPNNAFWKSFTATREEFPYTYTPRKAIESRNMGGSQRVTNDTSQKLEMPKKQIRPNKFKDVKDWEIDKLTDIMVKSRGKTEVNKRLKKTNLQNKESLNFVAQYMGEIMSVVLEKLHVSDEMKDFYMDYDNLSKSQKEKFAAYWQNEWLRDHQSKVMQGTIRLFFDVYGADGNNEDFQELLEYARNIKPNRIVRQEEHDRLQTEYENALAIYPESDAKVKEPVNADKDKVLEVEKTQSFENLVEGLKDRFNVETYNFQIDGDSVNFVGDLEEAINEAMLNYARILPTSLAKKYVKYVLNHPLSADNAYKLTMIFKDKGLPIPDDKRVFSEEEFNRRTGIINNEFAEKYPEECKAAHQALADLLTKVSEDEISTRVFIISILDFLDIPEIHKDLIFSKRKLMDEAYNKYKQPLTTSEKNKIFVSAMAILRSYDPKMSVLTENPSYYGVQHVFKAISILMSSKTLSSTLLKPLLAEHINNYGGSTRYLLDNKVPQKYKFAKLEEILTTLGSDNIGQIYGIIWADPKAKEYLKYNHNELYLHLKNYVFGEMQ